MGKSLSQNQIHGSQPNKSDYRRIGFAIQTYIPTHVKCVHGKTSAQLVRGVDDYGHFYLLHRPINNLEEKQILIRNRVNKKYSDILYLGAKRKRDL